MRKSYIAIACGLALAGCAANPVISDYNGDSVKIQTSSMVAGPEVEAETLAEAKRICSKAGKQAEFASTRSLPNYIAEHLYLCL